MKISIDRIEQNCLSCIQDEIIQTFEGDMLIREADNKKGPRKKHFLVYVLLNNKIWLDYCPLSKASIDCVGKENLCD